MPVYDEKYIKAKEKEFNGVIKTNFLGDEIRKENGHCPCMTCITIDSVMKWERKSYSQIYLEKCQYGMKKAKMPKFINTELKSEPESELESDTKLEAKLESDSDFE